MVIILNEYTPRFAGLIGKRDPVSTLVTLILLSYAKLLSITITALSFAILNYPDGKQETVWLPDGNVKYFQRKHIPLSLTAMHVGNHGWLTLHDPYLLVAVDCSCFKIEGFQLDN